MRTSDIIAFVGAVGVLSAGMLACEPPPAASADGTPQPAIASVYRSRCGGCHMRVEPGARSREYLESAFARHRVRLRLREDQWRDLVTYLAILEPPPPSPAAVPCSSDPPHAVPDEKSSP